jgi:ferrous iron transport protein A
MVRLSQLPLRQSATLLKIGGTRAFRRRLMELGLVPGTPVQVVNVSPLGDPIELQVREGRLSIRRREAESLMVHP